MISDKQKKQLDSIKDEATLKVIGYITAAFGLVAGLAWNEAVKGFIEQYFPNGTDSVTAKFVYAVALSVVVALLTIVLTKAVRKLNERF